MFKMMRISENMNDLLDKLSKETGEPKQELLEKAVRLLDRQMFLKKMAREAEILKRGKKAWIEYQEEMQLWEGTLLDGLED